MNKIEFEPGKMPAWALAEYQRVFTSLYPVLLRIERAKGHVSDLAIAHMAGNRASVIMELVGIVDKMMDHYKAKTATIETYHYMFRDVIDAYLMMRAVEDPLGLGGKPAEGANSLTQLSRDKLTALFQARGDAIMYIGEAIRDVFMESPIPVPPRKDVRNLRNYMKMVIGRLGVAESGILAGEVDLTTAKIKFPVTG